jgi:hypothetical protein
VRVLRPRPRFPCATSQVATTMATALRAPDNNPTTTRKEGVGELRRSRPPTRSSPVRDSRAAAHPLPMAACEELPWSLPPGSSSQGGGRGRGSPVPSHRTTPRCHRGGASIPWSGRPATTTSGWTREPRSGWARPWLTCDPLPAGQTVEPGAKIAGRRRSIGRRRWRAVGAEYGPDTNQ